MLPPLFVYGTLMYPDVFFQVSGRCPEYETALLPDFCPRRLSGRPYPGLVPCLGYQTKGLLLYGLDLDNMARLDAYEGEEYTLVAIEVISQGQRVAAQVYALSEAFYGLLEEEVWEADPDRL